MTEQGDVIMKKYKKVFSVWLATLILILTFSSFAGAEEASGVSGDNSQEAAPFVFVHGLFGWGQYDEIYEE